MTRDLRSIHPAVAIGVLALAAAIAGCSSGSTSGSHPPASSTAGPATAAGPAASTSTDVLADIDIGGGRTMHLLCVGPIQPGKPTVVFESGLGGDAGQWSDVIHELDGSVRACAYDRAGNGQSPPTIVGRTTTDQISDLRALLTAANIAPPYLLVGYSLGGWNVMVHADAHPGDIVGAVFADVRPPAASREWLKALPSPSSSDSDAITAARDEATTFDTDPTLNPEGLKLGDSASEAIVTKGFGAKPLIVLAATDTTSISEGFEPALGTRLVDIWWKLQADLATRSTTGRLEKVDNATHGLPFERPDAVADAIQEILGD